MKLKKIRSFKLMTITAAAGWLALIGAQSALGQSYSGQATVINISNFSYPSTNAIVIADTGPLPGSGGNLSAFVASSNIFSGAVTLQNASATVSGQNNESVSAAFVQNFSLEFTQMGGSGVIHTLTADFISANAVAACTPSGVSVGGGSQISGLVIDGNAVAVTGAANQTIDFSGFTVVLNEQTIVSGTNIIVTAIQVSEQGCMDALLVTASADIACSPGCPPCVDPQLGLGAAGSGSTVLELGPHQVSINGPAGGILGNVYIAPDGSANFSGGGEYLTGNVYLGAGATYQNSGVIVSGSIFYNQNLSAQISAAYAANANDASLPATQTFTTLDGKSVTMITGNAGLNVIDVQNINLSGTQIAIYGPVGAKFIFNVTGNFVLTGGGSGPQIYVAGGVQSSDVLFNIIGNGQDVAFSGGGGGANCCAAVVDGTLLAPYRKIALSPGLVNGEVISGQDISIVSGSSVRCPSCQ